MVVPFLDESYTRRSSNSALEVRVSRAPGAIVRVLPLRDDAPRAIYRETAQRGGYKRTWRVRCTGDTWSRAITIIQYRQV